MWKSNFLTVLQMAEHGEINKFLNANYKSENCDTAVTDFVSLVSSMADKSLKKITPKRKTNRKSKTRNKTWFDQDCRSLQKDFKSITKLLNIYPRDPLIRGRFFNIRKNYKNAIKKKKKRSKDLPIKQT